MNCTVTTDKRALFDLGVKEFDALAAKAPVGSDGVCIYPILMASEHQTYLMEEQVLWV